MSRLLQILCTVLAAASLVTAADLGQLQQSFMKRYDEANATRDKNLKKIESSYLGALKKLEDRLKDTGDLDQVLPVRAEILAVEGGAEDFPDLPEKRPAQLPGMRRKFVSAREQVVMEHARELVTLVEKMDTMLSEQETRLTREGDVDGALAARKMSETLEADAGIRNARELLGRSGGAAEGSGDAIPLAKFLPGTVWAYQSGPKNGSSREGFILFFAGGKLLNTLPNAGPGTWKVVGDKVALTVEPYPTVNFTVDEERRSLNGDDETARRRGTLHAVPVQD